MSMRRDQKGYTIAELLIAVAILSIVVASVCGFILVGSRSYAAGNSDISVQQESQLALNQMSDVLIDTTRSVIYAAYDASGNPELALKDAEFTATPEDKSLIMFNGVVVKNPSGGADTLEDGNGNKHYHFYWNKAKETLFYAEQDIESDVVDSADILHKFPDPAAADPDADPETTKWYVLATHVTDFSADLSQLEEKRVVQLALTFLDGTKEYVTSNNVTIRNKVGVNDVELAPLNRSVEIDISVKSSFILEPGETFTLPTPKVTGKNVTDKTVTWSFGNPGPADDGDGEKNEDGTGKYETTLTPDGILKLADRAKGSFKVKATTNAEDSENNQASAEVTIYVKRVTGIDLWKSYDSAGNPEHVVSPGCTFTISGRVVGDYLDQTCDCCGEDPSIDRHILSKKCAIESLRSERYVWRVWDPHLPGEEWALPELDWWHPLEHIIEQDQDEFSVTYKVQQGLPDLGSHGYVIQVMSLLSYYRYGPEWKGRSYPWVWPSYDFTVLKSNSTIDVSPGFKWGAMSYITIGPEYPDGFNKNGQGYYLICARIKEKGSSNEKIMIYGSNGNDIQVTPDLFGLDDIRKTWELSLQVIDPGGHMKGGVYPGPGVSIPSDPSSISDATVRSAVQDYLANCDASGTYNGSLPHTGKYVGTLMPPVIHYAYDGREDIAGELELNKANTLIGPVNTSFNVVRVENTRGDRDGVTAFTNNNMKFSVYKEMPGGTEKIYEYDSSQKKFVGNDKITYSGNNYNQPYDGMITFEHFDRDVIEPNIKLEFNKKDYFAAAAGKYRIVPSITYTQIANVDTSYVVYYANYSPIYGVEQCYEMTRNTVYYELINGGNLKLWSYYNEFTKGQIYFPTPSEAGFTDYFSRENTNWQNAKKLDWFVKSIEGRNDTTYYVPSSMRCRYEPSSKNYVLELYYYYNDETWNRYGEVLAGTYRCEANGDSWHWTPGPYDSQLERGDRKLVLGPTANMKFTVSVGTYNWNVYIPLPSEKAFSTTDYNGFGFKLKQSAEQSIVNKKLNYQNVGNPGSMDDFNFTNVSCTYDATKDEYKLVLTGTENDKYTFTCKSDGKEWKQQQP